MKYLWHKGLMSLIYKELCKSIRKKWAHLFLALSPHSNKNSIFKPQTPLLKVLQWLLMALRIESKTLHTAHMIRSLPTSLDSSPTIPHPSLSGLQSGWSFFQLLDTITFLYMLITFLESHHHSLPLTDAHSFFRSQLKYHFSGKSSVIESISFWILYCMCSS